MTCYLKTLPEMFFVFWRYCSPRRPSCHKLLLNRLCDGLGSNPRRKKSAYSYERTQVV